MAQHGIKVMNDHASVVVNSNSVKNISEPLHKKTNKMLGQKQRRRSASRFSAKLISAFVFAARRVQSFFFNQKFQAF